MKAITLRQPAGLEHLERVDLADPGAPAPGEIRVRIDASSLNFDDLSVVTGRLLTNDGRIPMSDGACVVEAIGNGVAVSTTLSKLAVRTRPASRSGPAGSVATSR